MKQTHGLTSYLPDFFFTKCEVINFQMGARIGNCNRVLGVRPATEEELRTNPGPRYYMALSAKKGFLTETEEKTVDRPEVLRPDKHRLQLVKFFFVPAHGDLQGTRVPPAISTIVR